MESGETAEAVEGKTGEDSDSGRHDSRHYEKAEQEADYNSEPVQSRYTKSARGNKESGKKDSRKSAKKSKLESIVNEQASRARSHRINDADYLGAHLHENIGDYLEEGDDSGAREETWEGAVAFIYNRKKGEFLIEEEYGKQAGLLRLLGGQKETYDFSTFETEAREIKEEVLEPAKSVLLKYLKNAQKYGTVTNLVKGGEVKSDVLEIHVSSIEDWKIVSKAKPTGGAGPFHIKTYDELWSMPDSAFAYDHGPVIKKFILEEIVGNKSHLNNSLGYTNNYTIPIITTNYNHLQTINSFNKPYTSISRFN